MPVTLRRNKSKLVVESTNAACELLYSQAVSVDNERQRRRVASGAGVDPSELLKAIGVLRRDDSRDSVEIPTLATDVSQPDTFTIAHRPITQSLEHATLVTRPNPTEAVRDVLRLRLADAVFQWDDIQLLACLDIDYHGRTPPSGDKLQLLVTSVLHPRPVAWHVSRGGGLHAYYVASDRYAANELAVLAGVSWTFADRWATFDIVKVSRFPSASQPVTLTRQTDDTPTLARWLCRSIEAGRVEEYLCDEQLEIQKRYPHDRCPIDPLHVSQSGDPVWVTEQGVYCHSCAGRGLSLGTRRPGWAPWTSIVPGGGDPLVVRLAKQWCHWEHARVVIESRIKLQGETARLAYSAMLRTLHHPDDPRHKAVFSAGRDLIRQRGRWTSADGSVGLPRDIGSMLATLPATQVLTEDRKLKADASIVNRFQTALDLTIDGYPALSVVRGLRIFGEHLDVPGDEVTLVAVAENVRNAGVAFAPRYVKASQRQMTLDAAWCVVESVFPNINREYLQLLIVAKGCMEGRSGKPAFLVVDGPSASAKSGTVAVAAAICGDTFSEVTYTPDEIRLRQALKKASDTNGFVVVNEVMKSGRRNKQTPRDAIDPILNLTPESESHMLYVGAVQFGKMPPMIFTDTRIPNEIRQDIQLARRLTHVRLSRRLAWEEPMSRVSVSRPGEFRVASLQHAVASNVILSHVIDTYFTEPILFEDAAKQLGFASLEASEEYADDSDLLRAFFDAVCDAPAINASDAKRWPGVGWKLIDRNSETDVASIWDMIADECWTSSRRCEERDWTTTLDAKSPVQFDCLSHGNKVVVRFRVGSNKQPRLVNGDVLQ